jgi:hypothetical protein
VWARTARAETRGIMCTVNRHFCGDARLTEENLTEENVSQAGAHGWPFRSTR